jgi:hypothetical protein
MKTSTAIFNGKYFEHFGIHVSTCSLYGHQSSEIVNVELIIHEDQTRIQTGHQTMDVDYWGWLDAKQERFSMIYPKYFLLNMCFPNGISASEQAQEGTAYRLKIRLLSKKSN